MRIESDFGVHCNYMIIERLRGSVVTQLRPSSWKLFRLKTLQDCDTSEHGHPRHPGRLHDTMRLIGSRAVINVRAP